MKKLPVALAAILVMVAVAALYMWSQLHVEREQLAALQTRAADMEKEQKAAAAAASAAAAAAAAARAAAASATAPQAGAATPGAPPANARRPTAAQIGKGVTDGISQLMSNPDVLRGEIERAYPDAAKELGLSPLEANKFYDLLAKQMAGTVGNAMGLLAGGDSAAQQENMRKLVENQLASEKEMQGLLGGKYHQWQEYQGTVAARQQVEQLRMALGNGENALADAKAKSLVTALGPENARANQEMQTKMAADVHSSKNAMEEQLKYTIEHDQRLANVASSYLTSAQLDRYKQLLGQQEAIARMMMGASSKPGSAPAQGGAQR